MDRNKVILIIEDNTRNIRLINDILTSRGYHVLQACDGREGIELALQYRPDLILMDIQLPIIDGLTATNILKNNHSTSSIPVVALTAMAMKGDREQILASGCDDYLEKPFRLDKLINTLEKYL